MYVYYNKNTQRLEITYTRMQGDHLHEYMNSIANGEHETRLMLCKMFCIGFVIGNQGVDNGIVVLNDVNEFK